VYYRGSNDAWDGYGGVVVYTRDAKLPTQLLPRLREAAKKVNFDFDKDFELTDNSCPTNLSAGERLVLREKFAGKVLTTTEQQLQSQAVRLRGNAVNSLKAQKIYFENEADATTKAFEFLDEKFKEFEAEVVNGVAAIVEPIVSTEQSSSSSKAK
jgi:violaxanthin de-epoxidase